MSDSNILKSNMIKLIWKFSQIKGDNPTMKDNKNIKSPAKSNNADDDPKSYGLPTGKLKSMRKL